ncbi:MAG TPA: EscU/YscU/HrcU family type III secretion system export apparatus switch protein [Hyphomicrobiaceae bacterium]|nr:EscU/YscU/HrcU family type III secretion system export apparatus switch protein [Hyphomicrobiaceae bacterium]
MAEHHDKDSKTEEATEKKLRDAIERGNTPFSKEAGILASLLGILIISSFLLAAGVGRLNGVLQRLLDDPGGFSLENGADAVRLLEALGLEMARLLLPAIIVLAAAGVLASFLQNSPRLVFDRIQPQLSRLSLSKGWQRLLGGHAQVEFLKAALKLAAVCLLGAMTISAAKHDVSNAIFLAPAALPGLIHGMAARFVATLAVGAVVLVAADLVWSRLFWQRELRMTRQELKEEMKQVDGDPIVKARLRSLARDRLRKRMIAAVPRASMVIANPTHFAVALRYRREEGGAPLVVAKGQDHIALKIREVAEQHGIPVIEDKALARSLYKAVEVDRMIPPEFYKAVAEIVIYLTARQAAARRPV